MKIHFIGIGGIGVSALARYYLSKGHKISGSDLTSSEITEALEKLGVKISIGEHKAENLQKNTDSVVYSPAIMPTNPEMKKAKEKKIKIQSYPEALGELTKKHFTIAVAGSHGKSTITAMIGVLLTKAKLDPTVIVGTKVKEFGDSNCRVGKSKYLVIEADEHFGSFLNYFPEIIVLPTLEVDHLDYYKNLDNLLKAFKRFVANLKKNGFLVVNSDDKNVRKVTALRDENKIYYSLKDKDVKRLRKILKIPGEFNVANALAALAVARILKIPDEISFKHFSEYEGSWRRFEIIKIKKPKSYTLINDYGHHPTQVRVTLKAAREKYPKKEIWCIYQPHQHERTHYLFDEFVEAFKQAPVDKLIITDIYDVVGREKRGIKKRANSKELVKAVDKSSVTYLSKGEIQKFLEENIRGGEIVILMGAGDIYDLSSKLK
ncbi:MAG: UDP-N-acetylmuramate--L-alanine ligase [Patescibacteria group bacterium]|nr:UDP-N-acetylmuramate--L-alanine ligase [Patescibacteria group bacterium]